MDSHPLISLYSKDYKKNSQSSIQAAHPLILIVGREPSNTGSFENIPGPYDFDWAKRCAFWNESYAVVSKVAGMRDGQHLKDQCRKNNLSPIAFTDISPVLIENRDPLKHEKRREITEDQIEKHIDNVVQLNEQIGRTTVVLLTGHRTGSLSKQERRIFDIGATKLEEALTLQNTPHISVPFMFGNNQSSILNAIHGNEAVCSRIQDAVKAAA